MYMYIIRPGSICVKLFNLVMMERWCQKSSFPFLYRDPFCEISIFVPVLV